MSDDTPTREVERFVEHPDPDRFFMQIEPAEVEMSVHDHDDVQLKSQHVRVGALASSCRLDTRTLVETVRKL